MKNTILTCTVLTLCGCTCQDYLYLDNTFFPDEQNNIRWAIDQWVEATNSEEADIVLIPAVINSNISYDNFHNGEHRLIRITSDEQIYNDISVHNNDIEYLGIALEGSSIILVVDRITTPNKFRHVILHELGHHYGITNHLKTGLMASGGNDLCIDQAALHAYCDTNYCGMFAQSTCDKGELK